MDRRVLALLALAALGQGEAPLLPSRFEPCPSQAPERMACVPGGSFVRGSDDDEPNARPAERIAVSTFWMDTHEVSNADWGRCVAAGACRRLMPFAGYMSPAQPAVAMRWDEAADYCRWRGARLPTEAEWERAASGPDDTRFAWGGDASDPCAHGVFRSRAGRGCGREVTWPVGSFAANAWGLHDMTGNVWEWVQDAYTECYAGCDRACGADCVGLDPRGPCAGAATCPGSRGLRVVRGGSWWYGIERAETHSRRGVPAANPNPHRFGFRCARSLAE